MLCQGRGQIPVIPFESLWEGIRHCGYQGEQEARKRPPADLCMLLLKAVSRSAQMLVGDRDWQSGLHAPRWPGMGREAL